jgi:hypothetical protein
MHVLLLIAIHINLQIKLPSLKRPKTASFAWRQNITKMIHDSYKVPKQTNQLTSSRSETNRDVGHRRTGPTYCGGLNNFPEKFGSDVNESIII